MWPVFSVHKSLPAGRPTWRLSWGPGTTKAHRYAPTGTCHAHSGVAVTTCALNAKNRGLPFNPSPLLLASLTYADVRAATTPPGQPLQPLQDTGADLSDDATALATWGIGPIGALIPGRYSDVPDDYPGVPFPEPPEPGGPGSELVVAGSNLIAGEYQIPVDSDAPMLAATALDANIPLWVGFYCDSAFENLSPSGVAGAPNENDPRGGGHAGYISAYRTAANGSYEFRVENSWGSDWCLNGACWASSAWLRACWTIWPFAVKTS